MNRISGAPEHGAGVIASYIMGMRCSNDKPNPPASSAQPDSGGLNIGPLRLWPPVVLAPMAGITNAPFRRLCREQGAALFISEMVTAHLLASRDPRTLQLAAFAEDEHPRSIQLYGVHPDSMAAAVRLLVEENHVDHIDLNFGCPVRKVTRKGGGAAIPLKPRLFAAIVRGAVSAAGAIPVTVKFRMGIDADHLTYLEAGRIAESEGCAAVALHARTAAQYYAPSAEWSAIARLKTVVRAIPVLGNGDIWTAEDALAMMRETGCDGVVVGRGCLGRPWLFRDLARAFTGEAPLPPPTLGETVALIRRHLALLCEWLPEATAVRTFRKHLNWYVMDYPGAGALKGALLAAQTRGAVEALLAELPPDDPLPEETLRRPRGKTSEQPRVALPEGYLQNLDDDTPPGIEAEDPASGG